MRIRNKRLVTTLVAAFLVVVMAGTAFAFSSNGPLSFEGTATVNADLELSIVGGRLAHPDFHERYDATASIVHPYNLVPGVKEAQFNVGFTRPTPPIIFYFDVRNTGTMPAVITGVNFVNYLDGYRLQPGHSGWDLWANTYAHGVPFSIVAHQWHVGTHNWSDINNAENTLVLQPDEETVIRASVRFLSGWGAADIETLGIGSSLVAEFVSTLTLDYGIAP